LTAAGDLERASFESSVRAHPIVRQRQKVVYTGHGSNAWPKLPRQTYPRFVRVRSTGHDDSSVIVAWPLVGHSERQQAEVRLLAALVQHRLSQRFGPSSVRHASARAYWDGHRGTLQVEVRPIRLDELALTEEQIFAIIDQLRSTQVGVADIGAARALAAATPRVTGDWLIDEAIDMADEARPPWRRHSKVPETAPTPGDLQHWAAQILSRLGVSEVFCEAVPPPHAATRAQIEGQRPKGLVYMVKPGESLQMIAHRFRVTIPDLIRANRLSHPDQIAPGARLIIPSVASTTPSH
jgi:hypothetical protein